MLPIIGEKNISFDLSFSAISDESRSHGLSHSLAVNLDIFSPPVIYLDTMIGVNY